MREIEGLRSEHTGRATTVNNVYLYFNIADTINRYYARSLDRIGPERDAGLPEYKRGVPSCMVSYPGIVLMSVDGGTSRYSSVLALDGTGWHEVYRAPAAGMRIREICLQVIPSKKARRLWISMGDEILSVWYSSNPLSTDGYKFTHESILETSWMYAKMKGVTKFFRSLKVFADRLSSNNVYLFVDYKMDDGNSWNMISGLFDESPSSEQNISVDSPPLSNGKRIKFRLRMYTTSALTSMLVKSIVLECYGIAAIKHGYTWLTKLSEKYLSINLEDEREGALGTMNNVEYALALLDDWASNAHPLIMRSRYSLYDNKIVVLGDPTVKALYIDSDDQIEEHMLMIRCQDL